MYSAGAEAVYNVAGPLGRGINSAVKDIAARDRLKMGPPFWIGVDADQDWMNPGFCISSMMKRIDRGVYYATKMVLENTFRQVVTETFGFLTLGIGTSIMGEPVEGISVSTLADLDEFIAMGQRAEQTTGEPILPGSASYIKEKAKELRDNQPAWIWDAVAELENKIASGAVVVPLADTKAVVDEWRAILG
jgi:basic membrane protein A